MRHCGKHRHSIIGNTKRIPKIRRKNKSKEKTQADPIQGCLRFLCCVKTESYSTTSEENVTVAAVPIVQLESRKFEVA